MGLLIHAQWIWLLGQKMKIRRKKKYILVPVFDLLNHAEAESATVYITVEKDDENPTNKYVCARASRKLLAGEELRFKYHQEGELLHYLFYYGFIPQDRDPMET